MKTYLLRILILSVMLVPISGCGTAARAVVGNAISSFADTFASELAKFLAPEPAT